MKNVTILIIAVLLLAGCKASYEKQKARATAFMYEHRDVLAPICATCFPVVPQYKPGKPVITHDTTYVKGDSIPCPEVKPGQPPAKVKCPDTETVTKTIYATDTITLRDEAAVAVWHDLYANKNDSLKLTQGELKQEKAQSAKKTGWLIGLGIIAAGALIAAFKGFKI